MKQTVLDVTFKPSERQYEAWDLLNDKVITEIGYGGGGNGGKSYLGSAFLTVMCWKYPGTRWLLGRKELKNLKRTTLVTLFKFLRACGFKKDRDFVYNQQDHIIKFKNGSEILLYDLRTNPSDPLFTELGGLELTGAWIDESNEISIFAINVLSSRLGRWMNEEYGLAPKLLETFNPDKGHVYSRYYRPWKNEQMGLVPGLPKHRKFIRSLATDNPYATKAWRDQILNTKDKVLIERLIKGNFEYDDDPDALFDTDKVIDLFTNQALKKDEVYEWYIICDAARYGADKAVITLWHGLQLKKVITIPKCSTTELANKIKELAEKSTVPYSNIVIDEDGVGGGVVDQVPGCKGFINNASPIQPRIAEYKKDKKLNYANLKAQCYYKLADYVQLGSMGIDELPEDIREVIKEELGVMKRYRSDKDGKLQVTPKDEVKEQIGRSPDYADTLAMRMFFEVKPKVKFQFHSLN